MPYSPCRMLFVVCALAMPGFHSAAYAAGSPTKHNDRQIAEWIKELGDDDFAVREKASRQLWLAGEVAETSLEKALQSGDPEVARRAQAILDKFRWGIYPDTPADTIALILAYQSSTEIPREQTLEKLLKGDAASLRAVLKIADSEKQPHRRDMLLHRFSGSLLAAFQRTLIGSGDLNRYDKIFDLAYDKKCIADNHYVAYALLRGQLDDRITQLRARVSQYPGESRFAVTLAYLHRAKGESREALAAAVTAKRDDFIQNLRVEAADWKTLASHPRALDAKSSLDEWVFRVAFARRADNREEFERAVRELLQRAENERNYFTTRRVVRTLLLNDRPKEALALLAKSPDHQTDLFDLLCARRQYREALELADQPRPADSHEQAHLNLLKARTLYKLGEEDKARTLFVRYGEQIKEGVNAYWAERLIAEEYEIGLKDLAFEHCARIKTIHLQIHWGKMSLGWGQSVFLRRVFPHRTESAKIWWELLRQKFSDDAPAATMKRLRQLLEGKTKPDTVKQWIEEVDQGKMRARLEPGQPPASPPPLRAGDPHCRALADAALANGLDELAESLLEKADTVDVLIRLGDLSADRKQWEKAAQRYRQAWLKNLMKTGPLISEEHGDLLPLYLTGYALRKQGRLVEGDKLIEKSHQLLLGNASRRLVFLEELRERGHMRDARREADLLLCVSEPNSYYFGAALYRQGRVALNRKDYSKANSCYERSMLIYLRSSTYYYETASYIRDPARIHCVHAAALLAEGKYDDASRHIDWALNLCPGNVYVAETLVPQFERSGHKEEADTLFARCLDPNERVCRDYPRCADSHNSIAWMSACCRRNLDKALTHAEKAVQLAPSNAGYLDTLAEVHFQRGDKDKALAMQKRAIELDPKKVYYHKQLKRIEAGDPKAERPPETED